MYNFIKDLQHYGMKVNTIVSNDIMRIYNHIPFSKRIELSIQASSFHYCIPKKTINLEEYKNMEVAFCNPIKQTFINLKFIINDSDLLKELQKYECSGVYGDVPVELIEKIYNYLVNNYSENRYFKHCRS